MKLFLVFLFFTIYSLFSQNVQPTSSESSVKEAGTKTPAKSTDGKPVETKSTPAKKTETKTSEAKDAGSKTEPAPKKELPPLQKEGGFLVLNGVKWQAENIVQKTYLAGKEECEKNGMRLPTRDELVDAYYSKYPEFRTPAGYYMSGNRRASDRSNIWFVSFDNGHHNAGPLTREYNIRCVKVEEKQPNQPVAPAKTDNPSETKK